VLTASGRIGHDQAMTRIRVLPRRPPWLDAALVSVETTAALVAAHVAAGGMLPSASWVVAMAASVFIAGLLVLRGTVRGAVAAPCLVAAQLALHWWLTLLPQPGLEHGSADAHAAMAAGHAPYAGLTLTMVLAHVAAGLFAAWALTVRRRAVRVVLTWGDLGRPAPARTAPRSCQPSLVLRPAQLLEHSAPRRGPPRALAA
jgi:hypothetical protein